MKYPEGPPFTLEIEGHDGTLPVLSSEQLTLALHMMKARGPSYFILNAPDSSYVQIAGAPLRLIIEYRQQCGSSFRHYVLGRPHGDSSLTSINYSGGAITLQRSEIFAISEALDVFHHFLLNAEIPTAYELRDATAMFSTSHTNDAY